MALLDIALVIAATGLPVFPCGRAKKPAISKKDGGHGFLDATTDPAGVRDLFARAPHAVLIGVPTGERSGFDALDFDYVHGAAAWEVAHTSQIPSTRTHRTKSGGKHQLYRHVPGVRNLASKFADGMDVRGDGGYIIYPPSAGYVIVEDVEIAEWPDWLLAIVLKAKPATTDRPSTGSRPDIDSKRLAGFVDALVRRVRGAGEGAKHYTLRNAAISLGGIQGAAGLSDHDAIKLLVDALPSSVIDWKGAQDTAAWGLEHGRQRPITLEDRVEYQRSNGHAAEPAKPEIDRRSFDGLDRDNPLQPDTQRIIRVLAGRRHVAADQGLGAMSAAGVPFYQRDRSLVRAGIAKAKASDGSVVDVPSIVPVLTPVLARALGQSAEWERVNKDGEVIRIDPPKEVVEQIAAMFGDWPFPPLAGVIGTPTMRPDGSLLLTPGYDAATGLVLMSPPPIPSIPDHPTKRDALDALALLYSLLDEFPFTGNDSLAVALSMLLTPVLRGALPPAVPMHVVAAPLAGTGKSYLADIASFLATGERCAVISVSSQQDETEKRLHGAALAGYPLIALDNCNGVLTGDFLAQVTERPICQIRPLGTSGVIRVANTFTIFANGNNVSVAADLVRRTLLCTLDANMEDPQNQVFSHNPLKTLAADRGKYVAACLVIARAYICAGMPGKLKPFASFERWSDLIRSGLVWLGWPDPLNTTAAIRAEDPARNERATVFEAWANTLVVGEKYVAGDLIKVAQVLDSNGSRANPTFYEALMSVAKSKGSDRIDGMRLGWWLRRAASTVTGKYKLTVDRTDPSRAQWSITRIGEG